MPYSYILPYMIHNGRVTPKALPPRIPLYPPIFDENGRCGYHDGSTGHTTNNCKALKYKVQELVDAKLLNFKEMGPKKNNPLTLHYDPFVNVVEYFVETKMLKEVKKVKTHMLIIHERLTEAGMIQEVHGFYEVCLSSPKDCEDLKRCLQELTNQGMMQTCHSVSDESVAMLELFEIPYLKQDAQESPLVICFPAPFPFERNKVVPWKYNTTTYVGDKSFMLEPDVVDILGVEGMTQTGSMFAPEKP